LKRLSVDSPKRDKRVEKDRIISELKKAASMILDDAAAGYFATIMEIYGEKRTT